MHAIQVGAALLRRQHIKHGLLQGFSQHKRRHELLYHTKAEPSGQPDLTLVGLLCTHNQRHKGTFAAPIMPHQTNAVTVADGEVQMVE